jgi:tRNA(fMet)-specific endonuclease VapC
MSSYMLDTDLCIRVLRDRTPELNDRFSLHGDALCISTITLTELLVGAAKSMRPEQDRQKVDRFAARLKVLPFDVLAAEHAAEIRAALERIGRKIGPHDSLIAGHARSRGLIVVTGNVREFGRVDGLRCENWFPVADGFHED